MVPPPEVSGPLETYLSYGLDAGSPLQSTHDAYCSDSESTQSDALPSNGASITDGLGCHIGALCYDPGADTLGSLSEVEDVAADGAGRNAMSQRARALLARANGETLDQRLKDANFSMGPGASGLEAERGYHVGELQVMLVHLEHPDASQDELDAAVEKRVTGVFGQGTQEALERLGLPLEEGKVTRSTYLELVDRMVDRMVDGVVR